MLIPNTSTKVRKGWTVLKSVTINIRIVLASITVVFFAGGLFSQATVPGKFTCSWIGNTFGGKINDKGDGWPRPEDKDDDWIQNYIRCMYVAEDGTVYTESEWDEAGRTHGIYKDGDVLGNEDKNIECQSAGGFKISGNTISGNGKTITDAGKPTAIAMGRGPYAGKLLVADNGVRKQVLIYDVSGATPTIVEKIGVEGGIVADYTPEYEFPAAINAPAYPVKRYPPGYYHPWKLWGLSGVGCDNAGRIFVSTCELGSSIRCFKKKDNKWILDWRVEGYFFVDNVYYDEKTDAVELYGIQEHFRMDYSQNGAGKEWALVGYTVDSYNYPHDPRAILEVKAGHEHGLCAAYFRDIDGTRYLWSHGMTCQPPVVFRFKPGTDIAVPCGMFMKRDHRIYNLSLDFWWPPERPRPDQTTTMYWTDKNNDGKFQANEYTMLTRSFNGGDFYIDRKGAIWQGKNPITKWNPTFDANGNIIYSDANAEEIPISGVGSFSKIVYQEDEDRLVVMTSGCRDITGGKVYVVENWSKGNRAAVHRGDIKGPHQSSWTVAGDYYFDVGWETRAKTWVSDLQTGKLVGTMQPDGLCGGLNRTGWVDIGSGIQAYKRKNGEYLVFVEDDFLARVMLYRWCPTGDCVETTPPSTNSEQISFSSRAYEVLAKTDGWAFDIRGRLLHTFNNENIAKKSTCSRVIVLKQTKVNAQGGIRIVVKAH